MSSGATVGIAYLAARGASAPIGCLDGPVAAVSGFLFERGANIVSSHQYSGVSTALRVCHQHMAYSSAIFCVSVSKILNSSNAM
jgi:formyltetrahydrofolate hydrolase